MDILIKIGETFINLINTGGETLIGLVSGILPAALVGLTIMNTIARLIGQERIEKFAGKVNKSVVARYFALPWLANFFFSNPSGFIMGRFLPEKYKPGYYEAVNSSCMAPMMTFFPHVNPAELYAWLGIASGISKLGLSTAPLAISVFVIGMFTTTLKAFVIEKAASYIAKRNNVDWDALERRKAEAGSAVF